MPQKATAAQRAESRAKGNLNLKPFPKGTSGNPGGTPKSLMEVSAMARAMSPSVLERLYQIATKARHLPSAVAAANAILDRAYGRPPAAVHISAELNLGPDALDLARLTIEELRAFRELLGKAQPVLLDVTPAPGTEVVVAGVTIGSYDSPTPGNGEKEKPV